MSDLEVWDNLTNAVSRLAAAIEKQNRSPAQIREDDRLERIQRAVDGRLTPEELADFEREKRGPRLHHSRPATGKEACRKCYRLLPAGEITYSPDGDVQCIPSCEQAALIDAAYHSRRSLRGRVKAWWARVRKQTPRVTS